MSLPTGRTLRWVLLAALPMLTLATIAAVDPVSATLIAAAGRSLRAKGIDIERRGLVLMRDQRVSTPIVAEFCQMTSATREGVRTQIMEELGSGDNRTRSLLEQPTPGTAANQIVMQ